MSASMSILVIIGVNLITNNATHHGPTDRTHRTTIRQDSARDATNAGSDHRVLVLL